MVWNRIKATLASPFKAGVSRFVLPRFVLEVEPGFVAAWRLEDSMRPPRLKKMGARKLDPGVIDAHPDKPNVTNLVALRQAVREISEEVGSAAGRCGLIVPDGTSRLGLFEFETLPADREDLEALLRWRMKDLLPYPAEEARVSYQVMGRDKGRIDVMAVAARNSVLAEYEGLLEQGNGGARLILPSTLSLLPLLPETDGTAHLLTHVCCGWVTTALVVASRLRFWRSVLAQGAGPEDWTREAASEAVRVLASARDHLQVEVGRVWISSRPPAAAELGAAMAHALEQDVEVLEPAPDLASTLTADERSLYRSLGATVAGLVANTGSAG